VLPTGATIDNFLSAMLQTDNESVGTWYSVTDLLSCLTEGRKGSKELKNTLLCALCELL
jgi:hypothetical protein